MVPETCGVTVTVAAGVTVPRPSMVIGMSVRVAVATPTVVDGRPPVRVEQASWNDPHRLPYPVAQVGGQLCESLGRLVEPADALVRVAAAGEQLFDHIPAYGDDLFVKFGLGSDAMESMSRGEHPGHDVPSDVGAQRREHEGASARVHVEPDLTGQQLWHRAGGHDERRDAEGLGVDAERELGHRDVAADRHLVDVGRLDPRLLADLARELVERLGRARL